MELHNTEDLKQLAPVLAAMGKNNPFGVPTGYFDNLQENLTSRIRLESLHSEPGFSVPDGYFDTLQERIISQAGIQKRVAKIEYLQVWVRYAAAACITLILATSIFLVKTNKATLSQEIELSSIPDDEIISYLQIHNEASDTEVIFDNLDAADTHIPQLADEMSEEELQHYLNTTL